MTWKTVRLELARSADLPRGSASRTYLLRVPLDETGLIDETVLGQMPLLATARRFWSSEPDQFGRVERLDGHWLFRCMSAKGETISRMAVQPLRLNEEITVEGPDGAVGSFRVASIISTRTGAPPKA